MASRFGVRWTMLATFACGLIPGALSGDEKLIKQISEKLGIKIKSINVNSKFFIIDRKEILFYISKNSDEDSAIWLNSEFFSQAFAALFERAVK